VYKLGGKFFKSTQNHSPFDVVAWHGNYVRAGFFDRDTVKWLLILP
jgi:homogentisate 1,2-dioxygenase